MILSTSLSPVRGADNNLFIELKSRNLGAANKKSRAMAATELVRPACLGGTQRDLS